MGVSSKDHPRRFDFYPISDEKEALSCPPVKVQRFTDKQRKSWLLPRGLVCKIMKHDYHTVRPFPNDPASLICTHCRAYFVGQILSADPGEIGLHTQMQPRAGIISTWHYEYQLRSNHGIIVTWLTTLALSEDSSVKSMGPLTAKFFTSVSWPTYVKSPYYLAQKYICEMRIWKFIQ